MLAERPREVAAVVLTALEIDDERSCELGFGKDHQLSTPVRVAFWSVFSSQPTSLATDFFKRSFDDETA
jgi:hypothetical protein